MSSVVFASGDCVFQNAMPAMMGGKKLSAAFSAVSSGEADAVVILENDLYRHGKMSVVDEFLKKCKQVIVMDHTTGKVVASLPIGDGSDAAGFDPDLKLAFSSNGAGTLTVIREDSDSKFTVLDNIATQSGARTMAVDAKTHKVYLAAAKYDPAPAATTENPRPRPRMIPGSFVILVYGK